jgi:hypothetical protein
MNDTHDTARDRTRHPEDLPPPACPYQVKGRLLTGAAAVICTQTPGSCPLQRLLAMTRGRPIAVCLLRDELFNDWQQVPGDAAAGAVRRPTETA